MKSILMGGEKIFRVYSPAVREKLSALCGLIPDKNFGPGDHVEFAGVEFIFSTWGMPRFSA